LLNEAVFCKLTKVFSNGQVEMTRLICAAILALLALAAGPAQAQFTVLDHAQDGGQGVTAASEAAPGPLCGTRTISIARVGWPSAQLLAEIHARLLVKELGCTVWVMQADLAAIGSTMSATGEPAVAPEVWTSRIAELWNAGLAAQTLRSAAPTYGDSPIEGWFIPDYLAQGAPQLTAASGLAAALPGINGGKKVQFISCPPDWACAVINRNLIAAYRLDGLVEIVEPANRLEMDTLIAQAVSRKEPVVFYYWQPNAILAQLSFKALDMGAFDMDAAQCLAQAVCADPHPSAFVPETIVVAISEWLATDVPVVAGYFRRSSLALSEMNTLLAQLNEPGASIEAVADRFVATRQDIWGAWVGGATP
jgi:glycine betaine/proline transport system substrate-binding protein